MTLTEQEFRLKSDEALEQTRRALMPLSDEAEFEVEMGLKKPDAVREAAPFPTESAAQPNMPTAIQEKK